MGLKVAALLSMAAVWLHGDLKLPKIKPSGFQLYSTHGFEQIIKFGVCPFPSQQKLKHTYCTHRM